MSSVVNIRCCDASQIKTLSQWQSTRTDGSSQNEQRWYTVCQWVSKQLRRFTGVTILNLNYQSSLNDLTNYISDCCFHEIIIMGDCNCDPNKGRFFWELQSMANSHSLLCCDVHTPPASTFKYISLNQSATCIWLDPILTSKKELVCQVKILYRETLYDHIPIYCELVIPNYAFTESVNAITEGNFNIVRDEISDDQFEAYGYTLDNFSFELWADFLSCSTFSCDNA